jgi:hypothetical protein
MILKALDFFRRRNASTRTPVKVRRDSNETLAICAVNFWPSFSLAKGFWNFVLTESFGRFRLADEAADADIVLTSVFPHEKAQFPEKTIAVIWENIRPNYEFYRFSISSDFDGYQGRNCRVPNWYEELAWNESFCGPKAAFEGAIQGHGHEERVEIARLMAPGEIEPVVRPKFCCLVTSYREPYRALAAEALSQIGPVDIFGNVTGAPLLQSKYEALRDYRFNLCFENSIFPGYYTEKALQAWAAGCIPLYFSDPYFGADFNPKAMINRIGFRTLAEFVEAVRRVNDSPGLMAQFRREPLLTSRPSLDPVIAFLRGAGKAITGRDFAADREIR